MEEHGLSGAQKGVTMPLPYPSNHAPSALGVCVRSLHLDPHRSQVGMGTNR